MGASNRKTHRSRGLQWKNVGIVGFSLGGADGEMIRGIIQYKTDRACLWNLVLGSHNREDFPHLLDFYGLDGIITHVSDRQFGAYLKERKLLTVDVAGAFPEFGFPVVTADQVEAARLAVDEFLNGGYQNFWVVDFRHRGGPSPSSRCARFIELLAKRGYGCRRIGIDEMRQWELAYVRSKPWPPLWHEFLESIKGGLPAAVFALTDRLGVAFVNLMRMKNIDVPGQVAVMGVGDVEVICETCTPPLTSIQLPMKAVGHEAALFLDLIMQGKKPPTGPIQIGPDHVTVRQSTSHFAVSDPLVARALQLLDQHHTEPFTVKELAHHLNATVRSIQRHFDATLKRSPKQELMRIRVAHAQKQILSTSKQLKEIAYDTGFPSQSTFERAFRQIAGLSASAFQEKYRTTPR